MRRRRHAKNGSAQGRANRRPCAVPKVVTGRTPWRHDAVGFVATPGVYGQNPRESTRIFAELPLLWRVQPNNPTAQAIEPGAH